MTPLKTRIAKFAETVEQTKTRSNLLVGFRYALAMIIIAMSLVSVVRAQDPVTVTPDGKVGVGTTAPANKLSVAGDSNFTGKVGIGTTTPGRSLEIRSSETGYGMMRLRNSAASSTETTMAFYPSDSAGDGDAWVAGVGGWSNTGKFTIGYQAPRLIIDQAGNTSVGGGLGVGGYLGIGTTGPARALDIRSTDSGFGMVRLRNTNTSAGEASIGFWGSNSASEGEGWVAGIGSWGATGKFTIGYSDVKFLIDQSGNVGIGTTTPGKGKLEINGSSGGDKPGFSNLRWFSPNDIHNGGSPNEQLSIYASSSIGAANVFVFSDARIKKIHGRSDGAKDMQTLLGIEITDYDYGDTIEKGRASAKKVIGQQVEKVFPAAVRKSTDVVPDIYQKATIKDGWVMLATDLKKGDRVRLIGKDKESVQEVLEVAGGKFRTAFAPEGDQVFVYGREVNDFRNVDYDAISMLNVSATQYLKKEKDTEVKALQEENAALRNRLAAQEQRLSELEAKIDTLLAGNKQTAKMNASKKVD